MEVSDWPQSTNNIWLLSEQRCCYPAQLHPPIHLRHTNRKSAGSNAEQFTECFAFLPSRKYTKAWPLLNGALGITTGVFGVVGACSCYTEQMVRCSSDFYIAIPHKRMMPDCMKCECMDYNEPFPANLQLAW